MHVVLDPQFSFGPCFRCDPGFEVFNLEPVFNIDGEKKCRRLCQNPILLVLGGKFGQCVLRQAVRHKTIRL